MANYKMILQYDGTRYRGWQVLPAELTIQGKLQDVLSKMAGYQVEVTGSGRTDAGVHAKGQTANFHLREEWDEDKILFYLNQYLPEDIAVCEVKRVDERFHSRYQAVEKTYLYRIHTGKIPEVFERRYVYDYTEPLDVNRMRKAAEYLCGTHDFKSFCGNKKMKKSTVRTISRIQIKELPAPKNEWTCECGHVNTGKFCSECGKPAPAAEWTCECGQVNKGKFCSNCGKARD